MNVDWVPTVGSPSNFYKDSITIASLLAADSLDILNSTSTAFDLHASGTGQFDFTYTASSDNTDDLPIDNTQKFSLYATSGTFCNSPYNIVLGEPLVSGGLQVGGATPPLSFTWGPLFYMANATDVYNMQMALYPVDTTQHDLSFLETSPGTFTTALFKWDDANNNSLMEASEVTLVATGNHHFTQADSPGRIFVAPFDNGPVHLDGNSWYWSTAILSNVDLFLGVGGNVNFYNRLFASDHLATGAFKSFWAPLFNGSPDGNGTFVDTISMIPFAPDISVEYQPTDSVSLGFGKNTPAVALNTYFIPEGVKNTQAAQPNNFSIFPNPASDYVNVKLDFKAGYNTAIDIMNGVGQVVYKMKNGVVKNETITVPTANLPAGNYYILVQANGRTDFKSLTIVKH
jgi:hypothetical protein